MSTANFRIDDRPEADEATLVALSDRVEPSQTLEFQVACLQLLDTGRRKLFVNLSGVRSIPSVIFGAVLDAYALSEGRQLVLVADAQAADAFRKLVPKLIAREEPPAEGPAREPWEEEKEEG